MASPTFATSAMPLIFSRETDSAPAQGSLSSAGAGITGGYTGGSLSLQIIIAFLIGLSLYNSIELIVLILVTFTRYGGLYFWSLLIAGFGIMPYSLGFLIKFFQLLDPNSNACYVAIALLTVGWYMMVTGQSVVLWSRLHLLTSSRRIIRWTLCIIIIDAIIFHVPTTILTFGANSNHFSQRTLMHFVNVYNIMEKLQMTGFFIQELILSVIYIKETLKILKLSESVQGDIVSTVDPSVLRNRFARKTMYQLIGINAIIISMDIILVSIEYANLYLIQTVLKGAVYSIKLKLEFAVLGKLVQIVRMKSSSDGQSESSERRKTSNRLEPQETRSSTAAIGRTKSGQWPDFVNPRLIDCNVSHALQRTGRPGVEASWESDRANRKRGPRTNQNSWIDEEMDKHNIG